MPKPFVVPINYYEALTALAVGLLLALIFKRSDDRPSPLRLLETCLDILAYALVLFLLVFSLREVMVYGLPDRFSDEVMAPVFQGLLAASIGVTATTFFLNLVRTPWEQQRERRATAVEQGRQQETPSTGDKQIDAQLKFHAQLEEAQEEDTYRRESRTYWIIATLVLVGVAVGSSLLIWYALDQGSTAITNYNNDIAEQNA